MHGAKDRADDIHALIDVAADEELLGGPTPKIDLPPAVGTCRRLEIHLRGLRRSAGIGQRLRQSLLPLEADWRIWRDLESATIERRGPIEGEGGIGFPRRKGRLGRGTDVIAGPSVMRVERLGIVCSSGDQGLDHEAVNPALVVWRHERRQLFADPVVIDLDSLGRSAAANETV